jgi:Flp pilus assembly protein TadG
MILTGLKKQRGNAMVEFALSGVPLIFVVISSVQMAIGMWHYHTLQFAVKEAGAYLAVHGSSTGYCQSNACEIENVAAVLSNRAIGLPAISVYVTFTPVSSADHVTTGLAHSCWLNA